MKRYLILAVLLAAHFVAGAQNDKYKYIINSIDTNDGLANNTVQAILQDRFGFIWFGTKDGLDRYDGTNLLHFSPKDGVNENNFVLSMCEDNAGNIWVGTSSGLCVYDPETETESCFRLGLPDVKDAELPVYQIVKDVDGTLWIPAGHSGFIHIFPEKRKAERLCESEDGRIRYYGSAICHDGKNTLYFIMDDGNVYRSSNHLADACQLFDKGVLSYRPRIIKYAFGKLFMGSAEEHTIVNIQDNTVQSSPWNTLTTAASTHRNELWVANDSGIAILDNELNETFKLAQDFDIPLSLQGKSAICMCEDREGGVWIGTFYAGVFHLVRNRANLHRYFPRSANDALGNHVRQILPDNDGVVWVTTEDNGLIKLFPEQDRYVNVPLPFHTKNIQCVCSDNEYLWIGSFSQKEPLGRMHKKSGRVELIPNSPTRIYSLCRASNGCILIGHSDGLSYLAEGKVHKIPIVNRVVHEVLEDTRGELWVSSGHDGLWHCRGKNWTDISLWEQFKHDPSDSLSLSSNIVTSVFEDSRSQIWVTTEPGGFCRMEPSTGKFIRYQFPTSFKISEDSRGLLWITTIRGLLCFNPMTGASHMLTREDGMLSNQYNYSSNVIAPDGTLYAGSVDGFISFNPSLATQLDFSPRILLTSFSVESGTRGIPSLSNPLAKSISSLDKLTLKYSENSFRVGVSTVNFSVPRNYYLMYTLNGYSDRWEMLSNGLIEVKNLPSGKYSLRIRSVRLDGTVESGEKSIDIEILRPFYLSVYACLIYVLFIISLVFIIRIIFHRVTEKKMIAEKKRVETENEKSLYAAKFDFVTKIAHEIKTPLSLIRGPLDDIREKMTGTVHNELLEDINVACSNTERLHELVGQLLDFSAIEKIGYTPRAESVDIIWLTTAVFNRFSTNARAKKLKFNLVLPSDKNEIIVTTDRDAYDKIASNLFSNAVKYAKTFVRVCLSTDGKHIKLVVENDGVTIPQNMREEIFKPFVRYSENSHVVEGTGIGLATSRTLANVLGGSLFYDDSGDDVNRFVAVFPMILRTQGFLETYSEEQHSKHVTGDNILRRILVVEDNQELCHFITRKLSEDYQVTSAVDGEDALKKLEENGADVIISDVMMPRMNGFELCQAVKENIMFSHIPIIILTAKTDVDSKVEGMKYGADMYMEKPFSVRHMMSAIDSILFNRELLRKHYLANPLDVEPSVSTSGIDSTFLKTISDFIYNNISNEDLKVKDIASATCMSESNLFRKTKELLGMRPNEYLQYVRLKVAAQILSSEDVSIAEVCSRVGFSSHSYFSNCFKKQFGSTPNDYRNSVGSACKDIDK